ncbi:MAG: hypothetical protein AAGM04_01895 [Pseudomonadota bacterium]
MLPIRSHIRSLNAQRMVVTLWSFAFGLIGVIFVFLLLARLGLPGALTKVLLVAGLGAVVLLAAWLSKTMVSVEFFYAGRNSPNVLIGIGGCLGGFSGVLLMLVLLSPTGIRPLFIGAILSGLALQTLLFSSGFHRSGVSTLPGFLAWRFESRLTGAVALIIVLLVATLLLLAELKVGITLLAALLSIDPQTAMTLFLGLTAISIVLGGWRSLLIITALLALFVLISFLMPAVAAGFFSGWLGSIGTATRASDATSALDLRSLFVVAAEGRTGFATLAGFWANLAFAGLLAAAMSVMPMGLSRLSLAEDERGAAESNTRSALGLFLGVSALPLSLFLLDPRAGNETLAVAFQATPVLPVLPAVAVLAAAFSAFTVGVFTSCAALARTIRRTRNLDPGERSMFATRMSAVAVCSALIGFSDVVLADTTALLPLVLIAASVLVSGSFSVVFAACWLSHIPYWASTAALILGPVCAVGAVALRHQNVDAYATLQAFGPSDFIVSSGIGLAAASSVLALGYLIARRRKTDALPAPVRTLRASAFEN